MCSSPHWQVGSSWFREKLPPANRNKGYRGEQILRKIVSRELNARSYRYFAKNIALLGATSAKFAKSVGKKMGSNMRPQYIQFRDIHDRDISGLHCIPENMSFEKYCSSPTPRSQRNQKHNTRCEIKWECRRISKWHNTCNSMSFEKGNITLCIACLTSQLDVNTWFKHWNGDVLTFPDIGQPMLIRQKCRRDKFKTDDVINTVFMHYLWHHFKRLRTYSISIYMYYFQ